MLDKIFLSDETKDFWFTAKEAEAAGIGYVTRIERRDSQPFKVAAKLDIQNIKKTYKEMRLLDENKAVARIINTLDGRQLIFSSENEAVAKGDTLQLVGSNENLQGKIKLSATLEATVDEENKVVDLADVEAEISDDQLSEAMSRIEAIETSLAELLKKGKGEGETPEAVAEAEVEAKAKEESKKITFKLIDKDGKPYLKIIEPKKDTKGKDAKGCSQAT